MRSIWVATILLIVVCKSSVNAGTATFEEFADGAALTDQLPSIVFDNALVLTAGISLNELDFPPRSGTNVVSDEGAPLSLAFLSPIITFDAYFTYATWLTLEGFDTSNNQVVSTTSSFSHNENLSGVPGSTPNEHITMQFLGGLKRITITGDLAGGSFTMDDMTLSAVPEPSSLTLFFLGLTLVCGRRGARRVRI